MVKLQAMDMDLNNVTQLIDSYTYQFTSANDSICPQHCDDFEYQQYISFSKLSPTRVNNILEDTQV